MWSVPEAKARLSEVLRKARAGEPQVIGLQNPCVILSMEAYARLLPSPPLGRMLVESAPLGEAIPLPDRASRRLPPFASDDV